MTIFENMPGEEGRSVFLGNGVYKMEWLYNDHCVQVILPSLWQTSVYNTNDTEIKPNIIVHCAGVDITAKYIEVLEEDSEIEIRPTLTNLMAILKLIDKNVDDYLSKGD